MTTFINSYEGWLEEYKKNKYNIWIRVILNNKQEIYLREYNEWFEVKRHCENNSLKIDKIGLQYRSNSIEVDSSNSDGVYVVRSILATFGQSERQTYTIGIINGTNVKKTIWIVPELVQHLEEEDNIAQCFEEAIIYNYVKKR